MKKKHDQEEEQKRNEQGQEEEQERNEHGQEEEQVKKERKLSLKRSVAWVVFMILLAIAAVLLLYLFPREGQSVNAPVNETDAIAEETETETQTEEPEETEADTEASNPVPRPDIDEQLLTINEWSRPGTKCDAVEYVVIHYLANPRTSAQQNHDYFESLKDLQDVSMSANFIVGLEGEIIECVPPGEIAWASNSMNHLSVSIENCHMDMSGRFTEATYASLVKLTAWVVEEYHMDREHIIRHYDVTGKECPIYYVENVDKWEEFKDDVMNYIAECQEAAAQTELQTEAAAQTELQTEAAAQTELQTGAAARTELQTGAAARTELQTEAASEGLTEASAEIPAQAPTEAPAEAPVEAPTEAPAEALSENKLGTQPGGEPETQTELQPGGEPEAQAELQPGGESEAQGEQ